MLYSIFVTLALFRRLLTVRLLNAPVDNPSASQRVCSSECLLSVEPFKESIFSWSRFQRPSCPLAFFYTPGFIHALLQSNNDQVAYIESFSNLSVGHTTLYHSNRWSSLCSWQLWTCHVEIKLRKLEVLPVLANLDTYLKPPPNLSFVKVHVNL